MGWNPWLHYVEVLFSILVGSVAFRSYNKHVHIQHVDLSVYRKLHFVCYNLQWKQHFIDLQGADFQELPPFSRYLPSTYFLRGHVPLCRVLMLVFLFWLCFLTTSFRRFRQLWELPTRLSLPRIGFLTTPKTHQSNTKNSKSKSKGKSKHLCSKHPIWFICNKSEPCDFAKVAQLREWCGL